MVCPKMFRVRQELEGPRLPDIPAAVRASIESLHLRDLVKSGQTVAITAGSRGIANIDRITLAVVDEVKSLGLTPFIVPAMGSHGGATAEGQSKVLEHYGVTESTMGCPVRSSMEVVEVGKTKGTTVYCDKNAWEADRIAVVGRVNAHPDFSGEIESGLFKMMAIGLGKQHGAENYHRAGQHYSYAEVFPLVGRTVLDTGHILFGLGIVQNGYGETAAVKALLPRDFESGEKALLKDAKAWMAGLPFDAIDLLIVDEMGKNINGAGMYLCHRAAHHPKTGGKTDHSPFVCSWSYPRERGERDWNRVRRPDDLGARQTDQLCGHVHEWYHLERYPRFKDPDGLRHGSGRDPDRSAHEWPHASGAGARRPDQKHAAPDRAGMLGSPAGRGDRSPPPHAAHGSGAGPV